MKPTDIFNAKTVDRHSRVPRCTTDGSGRVLSANDEFATLLGYHRDELPGICFDDLAAATPRRNCHWRGATKTAKETAPAELTLPARNGALLTALAYVQRITEESGAPLVSWLFFDVSRYTQAVLRQQALLDSVALGVFVSANRIIQRTNPMADEMFRAAPGALIGKPGSCIYPSQEAYERLGALAGPILGAGEQLECDLEFRRMDGELFPCHLRAKAVDRNRPELGTVWILEDRTDIKMTEAALRKALGEIEAIVDNAMIGMFKVEDRRIVWCNRKLEELLGYGSGELNGQTTRVCYASDADWEAVGEVYKDLVGGKIHTHERRLRRKDGSEFWCYMSGKALDLQEPMKSAIWLFEDVTWRKEAEQALIEARLQAEEATRAKSMFLANMSHEIRTPMNAIIGLSSLMQKMALPPKEQDYVGKIHAAGAALQRIVDDILDFTKIEAGRLELENTDFHIDSVLDQVTTLLGGKARDKGLELLFDAPPTLPRELLGDPLRLGQILTNLVDNAVKFTERGQVVIRLREQDRDADGVVLRFEVADTGIGMSEDVTRVLFQPFFQIGGSATRKFCGTGLGLSICKRLAEMMGGEIGVTSSPGLGSTFAFSARFGYGAAVEQGGRSLPAFAGMHVLVVDNNATARETLVQLLSAFKFRIDVAADGQQAVDAVLSNDARDPYNIVIVGWEMADIDGREVSRRIKNSDLLRSPPDIVMITASASENQRSEAEAAGIDVFLTKPVSQVVLENALLALFPASESLALPARITVAEEGCYDGLRDRRVLVVEDNHMTRQLTVALLERHGIVVDTANNGLDAVACVTAGEHDYDAVLMDLKMPVMDGYEATSKLRADDRFRDLPIIALTAHATTNDRQRSFAVGMNDHVTKPLDLDVLFSILLRCCQVKGAANPENETTAADDMPPLPAIPGLDANQGFKRVAGNGALYKQLLAQFVERQSEALRHIGEMLEKGEAESASKLAHALAREAGNLGAKEIWRLAAEFERLLRNSGQADKLRQLMQALGHELAYLRWAQRSFERGPPEA